MTIHHTILIIKAPRMSLLTLKTLTQVMVTYHRSFNINCWLQQPGFTPYTGTYANGIPQ